MSPYLMSALLALPVGIILAANALPQAPVERAPGLTLNALAAVCLIAALMEIWS